MTPWKQKFIVSSSSAPNTQYNWLRFETGKDNPGSSAMVADAWYQKLWNLDEVASSTVDATKTARKTPYDPCPAGWRVPTMAEWVAIGADNTSTGKEFKNNLLTINTTNGLQLILPAAGYRSSNDGSSYSQGSYGYYWSSSVPSGSTGARYVFFSSATFSQSANGRAIGFSVRCLQE